MIVHKGSPWKVGDLFRDAGDGEMQIVKRMYHPQTGRIIGEEKTNLLIDEDTVLRWAVNLDDQNSGNPWAWDDAAQMVYEKRKRPIR